MVDRARILRGIENLDRCSANVLVFVVDQRHDGIDDSGAADFGERIAGARAHPPVVVFDRGQQVLDRVRIAYLVENLDGGTPRVFRLVLQRIDQILDGVRMICVDQDVDRLVLHVEVRIRQHVRHLVDIDIAAAGGQSGQRRAAHHLVWILELHLKGIGDFRFVELGQQVHQVHLDDRIFAAHARDQIGHHIRFNNLFDNLEDGRFFFRLTFVGPAQQLVHAQVLFVNAQHLD